MSLFAVLTFRSFVPVWAAALLGLAAAAAVVLLYLAEAGRVAAWRRVLLAGVRAGTLGAVLFLALRPTLLTETTRQEPRAVALLVDDSQSMTTADPRPGVLDRWRAAVAFDKVPPDRPMPQLPTSADLPADTPSRPTRLDVMKAVLTNPRLKLLERLANTGPLRPEAVGAGRSPKDARAADWVATLQGKEPRSALADAVTELARRDEADRPAAVVLMTDGRDTGSRLSLAAAAAECRRAGLPVHAYCVGAAGGGRVEVLDVAAADTLFVDDTATVSVRFAGRGLTGPAELVATLNGREVARQAVDLGDGPKRETLAFAPAAGDAGPGRQPLVVSLKATGPEPAEDAATKQVRVSDRKLKVLVVDAVPRWDFKFLQRLLLRDRRVEATFWLTDADRRALAGPPFVPRFPPDRAALFAYDLLVLGDVPASALTAEQQRHVRDFVVEGGGLIVAAGHNHNPQSFAGTPLAEVLPVELDATAGGEEKYRPTPTPAGGRSPVLSLADTTAETLAAWAGLPELYWAAPVGGLKPAAEALLVHPDRRTADGKPLPVLAGHYYGKGSVLFVGFEETWRWRLNAADKFFGRFWGQLVYAAGAPRALGTKLAQLALDPAEPQLGQVGRVYARLFTGDLVPLAAEAVEATLTNQDGPPAPTAVVFRPVPNQPGDYAATLPFTAVGRFALTLDAGPDPVTLDYRVSLPPDHELTPGGPAEDELRKLAEVSGGRFYREEDLHTLPDQLVAASVPVTAREEFLLWNRWAFLLVFGLRTKGHAMTTLLRQLRAWRRREAVGAGAWAVGRWLAVIAGALLVACLTDLLIDRRRDTPFAVRVLLTAGQLLLGGAAAAWLWRRTRVPTLDALAGRAEAERPAFGHRLVTALQLTRAGARTDGMSSQLIAVVAAEAEQLAARHPLTGFADRRPLKRAAAVLAPVLALAAVCFLAAPQLSAALLARQALLPVDIPRAVQLADDTAPVWAAGDPVTVRLIATGDVEELVGGVLRVEPDGQPAETFPLGFTERLSDGGALFTATLPPMSAPFTFRGRVGDGRLKQPGRVTFEPRPAVTDLSAATLSPPWLDPTGKRTFRKEQPLGEVQALPFHEVEVRATFSKAVQSGAVAVTARDDTGREFEAARHPLALADDRTAGTARFLPPPRATAYRVLAADDRGFTLAAPPRRGLSVAADAPPAVTLLPEVLKDPKEDGPPEDYDVSGMPLRPGGQVQVGYAARSPLGLARAVAAYSVNGGPWTPLPLADTVADPAVVGPFVPQLGVFRESGPFGQVEFYRLPAADPEQPGGLEAGGRINFQTAALTKRVERGGKPTAAPLEVGDTVEIRVAVYDRHPGPHAAATSPPDPPRRAAPGSAKVIADGRRPAGWSPSVFKQVVSEADFEAWRKQHEAFRSRLGALEEKQRQVFPAPVR